jgi:hypothetical protein
MKLPIREYQYHVQFVNARIFSTVTAVSNRIVSPKTQDLVCYFLGAFANFRKATVRFSMPVCQFPASIEQLGSQWTDSHNILHEYFSKSEEMFHSNLTRIAGI